MFSFPDKRRGSHLRDALFDTVVLGSGGSFVSSLLSFPHQRFPREGRTSLVGQDTSCSGSTEGSLQGSPDVFREWS